MTSYSSKRWLKKHLSDPYVQKANKEGYRSRAVYKLTELNKNNAIIKPGYTVIDLGASPGSWSQYVAKIITVHGRIIALDLLPMQPIDGVDFMQGDFNERSIIDKLVAKLGKKFADCVISDMAPNTTGIKHVDQLRSIALAENVLDFAFDVLKPHGNVLVKIFQGPGFEDLVKMVRTKFKKVYIKKPKASRSKSYEIYLLAVDYSKS